MDRQTIHDKLLSVLSHIQNSGGYPIPSLTSSTRPLEDLQGFDSQMAVTATGLLAAALGVPIAAGRNVFRLEGGTRKLTINEVVDVLFSIVASHSAANVVGVSTPAAPVAP